MPLTDQQIVEKYGTSYGLDTPITQEFAEDPTWGDYGRLIATGGVQMGSGLGWLFNNFDWGQSFQEKSQKLSGEIMEGLSPQAKKALETEFLERDEGQLWTNNKWSKAKLTAAQSLLGTAAGMGLGAVLTRGLMAAGMARTATTAAGGTVQVPTKTAGAIGYGLGEAGVAAPSGAAGVEEELKAMSHDDLYANAIDYRAVYDSLEGTPEDRERRAKEYLAKAAAGDAFAMNLVSTFLLSAPLGAVVGGYTGKLPLASTRPRSIATGAAGEAGQEFLQSGAEAIGSNIAMQQADPSRSPFEGALEEAVGGAMAGGLMGGGFGTFTPLEMPETAPPSPDDSPLAAFNEATAEPIEDTLSRLGEALSADLNEPTLDQLQADMEPMDALDWQLQILGETLERDLAGQQAKFEDTERLERKARFGKLSEVETQVNERAKAETELERQRAEQKKKEEDEAFRQRELLIAQEGMNRETATQETELEMPTPTRAPAVNPEEQLEIERGIGGGGDVAGRPIETAPREVEVIKGAPGAPERSPRTPPPPSGTMAAKEEADRRLAERQIAPKTATFKDAFEQSQKAAEQREQQKQEQQQARKRAAKARERAARERAAQEEERLINDEARLEREAIQDESQIPDQVDEFADIDIPFAEDEFPPKPELEWADERLADRDYHRSLDRLVSETSAGGGVALVPDPNYQGGESDKRNDDGSYEAPTIRTSSTNPPWMQSIIAEERVGRDYIIGTVEKAKAGKRLGAKQKRIVQAMLDEVDQPSEYEGREGEYTPEPAVEMPEGASMMPIEEAEALVDPNVPLANLEEQEGPYLDNLEKQIREEGWQQPIEVTVDEDGKPKMIFDGNHRVRIAQRLGLKEVPFVYVSDRAETQSITRVQRLNARLLQDPTLEGQDQFKTNADAKAFTEALTKNGWNFVDDVLGGYYEKDGHTVTVEQDRNNDYVMNVRGREAGVPEREAPSADIGVKGDLFSETANRQIDVEEQTQGITTTDEAIAYAKQQKFDDESINMFDSVEEMDDPSPEARKLIDELMTFDPTTPAEQRNAFLDKAFDLESLYDKDLVQIVADLRYGAYLDIEEVDISEKTTRKTGPHFTGKILLAKRPGGKYQAGIERLWNTGDYGGMFSGPSFWGDHFDSREEALLAYLKPLQASMENFDRRNNSATTTTQENTAKRLAKQFQEQIDALNQPELVSYEEAPTEGPFKLNEARFNEEGPDTLEQVFSAVPPIDVQNRVAIDIRLKREGNKFITSEEAADKQAGWEKNAIEQGRTSRQARGHKDNFNRVIISLFDTTGKWANPYALAGYDVRTMDIKDGIDVTDFSVQYLEDMFGSFEGKEIYGVLAACPCTTFANSSTRWRRSDLPPNHPQNRHENADPEYSRKWIEEMWGKKAAEAVDENGDPLYATPHDYAIALVNKTIQTLEYLRPKFWAVENPEGRIEEAAGLPNPWRTGFQPHNFGDPYTKRTLLWGNFNDNLPTANVDPVEGSKMHTLSPSEDRAAQRSETPDGFALAFFQANNFLDTDPRERTMKDYWYVEGAIDEAFRAGVTEEQIRERVYLDVAFEPDTDTVENTLAEIRALIDEVQGGGPTTPPTTPPTPTPTPPTTPEVEAESETQTDVVRVGIGGAGSGLTNITIRQINDLTVQELAKKNDQVDLQFYALRLGLDDTGNKIALAKRIKNHLNASATETPATTVKPFIISPVIGKAGEIQGISQLRLKRIANNFAEVGDKVMQNVVTSDDKKIRVVGTKAVYTINVSNRQDGLYVDSVDVEHFGTPNTSGLPTDYKSKKVTHIKDALIALDRALQDKGGSDTQGRARYAVVKDLLNAPDKDFVKAVLGGDERKMGDVPDTAPLNIAVSELLAIEEQQRKDEELAATKAEAVTPEQMWPPGRVEKDIGKINEEFPGANIEVVSSSNIQDRLKAGLLPTLETFEEKIEDLTVPAMYDPDSKTIYIFKNRIMPGTNLRKLALHEMVHKGLDNMFDMHRDPKGRVEYNALMDDIYNRVPDKHKPLLKRIENDYKLDNTNLEDRRIAAEELVANLAERNVKDGIVARAIRFIRNFLERVGMITKEDAWTNEDIRKLIAEAHGAITAKDRTGRVTLTEEVVLGETGEVYEVEMPAAELLNEIEQRKAICKKIQACL